MALVSPVIVVTVGLAIAIVVIMVEFCGGLGLRPFSGLILAASTVCCERQDPERLEPQAEPKAPAANPVDTDPASPFRN